jgi:F-type H+-transporting ATPase subunit epsilon
MADEYLTVEVVAPDGLVWQGEAVSVIVRTTEGDLGILRGHEPIMAALVPMAAEILTPEGRREIVAVEGGFVSVFRNRVSLLSDSAQLAAEVSLDEARTQLAAMHEMVDAGDVSDADERRLDQLTAQVAAGEKWEALEASGANTPAAAQ